MSDIRQTRLSFAPWADPRTRRLPGVIPITLSEWLQVDDAYAGQMALRDQLITTSRDRVIACAPDAADAVEEMSELVMAQLSDLGFTRIGAGWRRPDGVVVMPDPSDPLGTLGRLVQQDLCLMRAGPDGHVLVAAVLCFPAGWTLAEKFGRPMLGIHRPVTIYTADIGARVQRLMDGVQPGRPLLRGTAHHSDAPLFNPRTEVQGRTPPADLPYLRVERQVLLRLPATRDVVFSIHTQVVLPSALSPEQAALLAEFPIRSAA